ncbi:hypothetical protein [Acrocarpospora sp. B8E8]
MMKPFEHPRWSDDAMAPVEITSDEDGKQAAPPAEIRKRPPVQRH